MARFIGIAAAGLAVGAGAVLLLSRQPKRKPAVGGASFIINRPLAAAFSFFADQLPQFTRSKNATIMSITPNESLSYAIGAKELTVRFDPALRANTTFVTIESAANEDREVLRRFKSLIETGEIPTTVGQPSGPRSVKGKTFQRRIES